MTDRERLLDLINQALLTMKPKFTFEALADYLLENGVRVLPVTPGDIEDFVEKNYSKASEVDRISEINPLIKCQNLKQSFGEICVKCNKCGRFTRNEGGEERGMRVDDRRN